MPSRDVSGHPYLADALPDIKQEMLESIGAAHIDELYEQIPERLRLRERLDLPDPMVAEIEVKRHMSRILAKNTNCEENLSFLGAGCWQHYVPAICDEIASRSEFLTSLFGSASSDHGRQQAFFEFCSQLGELIEMDVVGMPVYSWGCAAGFAVRMAQRLNGRSTVLLPDNLSSERFEVIRSYCQPPELASHIAIDFVAHEPATGCIDTRDLEKKLAEHSVAAVYFENPGYLGFLEANAEAIADLTRAAGAECIVGVDAISLGVIAPPGTYGADIVVGDTQSLGVHMNAGGGVAGFIATRQDERYIAEYPTMLTSIGPTSVPGEFGFGFSLGEGRTSYELREQAKDWTGDSVYLWTVVNAVYMSLLGPQGFNELGELIVQRSHYAASVLGEIPGLRIELSAIFFKEFVVNFDETGKTVCDVNRELLQEGIFGGKDLSEEFPDLGQSALYCVTEIHTQADLDRLAGALRKVVTR